GYFVPFFRIRGTKAVKLANPDHLMTDQTARTPHGSALNKAIAVLEAVTAHAQPIGLPELTDRLGLPRQTIHRILVQLTDSGLIKRGRERDRYMIGPRLSQLATGTLVAANHQAPVRSVLQNLVDDINETCNVGVLDGLDFVYLERIESDWPLRVHLQAGSRVPAYCTSGGKVLLAQLPARARRRLLRSRPLKAFTPATITDAGKLDSDLAQCRDSGFAVNDEEFTPGIVGLAVPVPVNAGQPVVALACHAPSARVALDELKTHVSSLTAAAARLARLWAGDL
ncbi:MAG: IclR family transcriptional regulator, partial [Aestuariivirgaceae bacterium]